MSLFLSAIIAVQINLPFFHSGEEKESRQLHQQAELAMGRKDFQAAKEAYTQLLEKTSPPYQVSRKQKVDWACYVDLVLRLSSAHLQLKECSEADALLQDLLEKKPPSEFLASILILKGRCLSGLQLAEKAFSLLKEAQNILALEEWRPEDRTFFHGLEYLLALRTEENLQKAHRFFSSGCYKEASSLYEQLLQSFENGEIPENSKDHLFLKKKLRFRLAEAHYLQANYEKTLTLLEPEKENDLLDSEILFLLAKAYQERKEYEKALTNFESYLHSDRKEKLNFYEQALFEKGVAYFQLNQFEQAKKTFQTLLQAPEWKNKPLHLSALFLVRLYLKEHAYSLAEEILGRLSACLSSQDPLQFESAFLSGEIAFQKKNYLAALKSFEKCFPSPPLSGRWCQEAIFRMGLCYLKMGDDPLKSKEDKELFFNRAEAYFNRLHSQKELKERASLALSKVYYFQFYHLKEEEALQKIENLLAQESPSFSNEGFLYSLLLRSLAAPSFVEKVKFLEEATHDLPSTSPLFAECWFQKGILYFESGLNEKIRSTTLLEKAIECFEKALISYEKNSQEKAAALIECEALACYFVHIPQRAISLCQTALDHYTLTTKEKKDLLYLQGLIALQLRDENSLDLAKQAFLQLETEGWKGGMPMQRCIA